MKPAVFAAALVTAAAPSASDILVVFEEGAPKDRFTISNTGPCSVADAAVTIDLGASVAGLIFDVSGAGAGVSVFQPLDIVAGRNLLKDVPVVSGVETKLILRNAPGGLDETLIRNIAKAHLWFEQIKAGKTLSEIAKAEATTNGRLYQLIDLAFLAPDIIRDALDGKHPLRFTSDWCVRHTLPADWQDQRALIATL